MSKKGEKMNKDIKLSTIYETRDLDKFVPSTYCMNGARIQYLKMKAEEGEYLLPMLEVTKTEGEKLEIWNDQDSYFASKKLGIPVKYFYSYRPRNQLVKTKKHLMISEDEINQLALYCMS